MKKILFLLAVMLTSCSQQNKSSTKSLLVQNTFLLRPEIEKAFGYSHAVKICNEIKISGAVSMDENATPKCSW